ncbi:MAG: head GIN domain-containing protein [Bacteroidota bacterium]
MKIIMTTFLSIVIAFFMHAQKRTVEVEDFSALSLGIPGTLYLKQGPNVKVEIDCDDDDFKEIEFKMSGDRLIITRENNWSWRSGWRNSDVTIYVTMKEIERLSVSGSGNIEGKSKLNVEDIELSISGSGDMELDLIGDELETRVSGSGSIHLSGSASEASARVSGSGKIKGEDLTVASFEAKISGSGSCYISVTEEIEASISGSGSVYYAGNPERVISNSSGSGKVKKI